MNRVLTLVILTFFSINVSFAQFTVIPTGTTDNLYDLSIIGGNITVNGTKSYLAKSYNECVNLNMIPKPQHPISYSRLQRLDSNNVFLYSNMNGMTAIYHSNDCGKNWIEKYNTPAFDWRDYTFFDTLTGIMKDGALLYRTNDGGISFNQISSPITMMVVSLKNLDDSIVCVGGLTVGGSRFCISKDRGNTWITAWAAFGTIFVNDFYSLHKDTIFAVTSPGGLISTVDGGKNWSESNPSIDAYSVRFKSAHEGYVVGSNNQTKCTVAKTNDFGKTWTYFDTGINGSLRSIGFLNDSIAFLSGTNGVLLRWNYKQTIFTNINENSNNQLNINIYPNPTTDKINFSCNKSLNQNFNVTITNLLGQVVFSQNQFKLEDEIDIKFIPHGIYSLKIEADIGQRVYKIIKE